VAVSLLAEPEVLLWRADEELGRTSELPVDDRDLPEVPPETGPILPPDPQHEKTRFRRPSTVVTHALTGQDGVTGSSNPPIEMLLALKVLFTRRHDRSGVVGCHIGPRVQALLTEETVEVRAEFPNADAEPALRRVGEERRLSIHLEQIGIHGSCE
jgi:hypothetical protein